VKTIKNGRESEVEHVWTLATNPLRCESHGRKASDQMRVRWELPQEQAKKFLTHFWQLHLKCDVYVVLELIFEIVKDDRGSEVEHVWTSVSIPLCEIHS